MFPRNRGEVVNGFFCWRKESLSRGEEKRKGKRERQRRGEERGGRRDFVGCEGKERKRDM